MTPIPPIKLSAVETRVLGLRVGHLTTDRLDPEPFSEALQEGDFDLCRLKIRADGCADGGVAALEEIGVPYFYAGGILRYRFDYRDRPYRARYAHPEDLEFVAVDEARASGLEPVVRRCFQDDPIGYYKTPWLAALFSKKEELDCLVDFFLGSREPGRSQWLVRYQGQWVGFIVMTASDGTLHTNLLGIAPEHRSRGLFAPMRDWIHLHASEAGLREEEGARLDNLQSQNVFEQDGLVHFGNETIFHVTPFLSRSVIPPLRFEVPADGCEDGVRGALGEALGLERLEPARRWRWAGRAAWPEGPEPLSVTLRVPIASPHLLLGVAELAPGSGGRCARLYLEYRRPRR